MKNFKKTFGDKNNYPKLWDSLKSPIDIYTVMEEVWKAALDELFKYWENGPIPPDLRCYNQWGKCPLAKRILEELDE